MGILKKVKQALCIHKLKIISVNQEGDKLIVTSMCLRCGATIKKS